MMLRPTAFAPRTSSPSSRSKRAARTNTKWIKRPALCASTVSFIPPPTIRRTTASSPAPGRTIPFQDPTYNTYQDISELPDHVASEIKHFFRVYKSLEGKETVVSDVLGRDEAVKIIIKCQNAYIEKYCR